MKNFSLEDLQQRALLTSLFLIAAFFLLTFMFMRHKTAVELTNRSAYPTTCSGTIPGTQCDHCPRCAAHLYCGICKK